MRTSRLLLLATLLGISPLAVGAQTPTPLHVGERVTASLAPGETHRYVVELDSGRFVLGQANQLGVDVVVAVHGPDDAVIGEFDTPARGPERFSFTTEVAGPYRIVVAPYRDDETGDYVLSVDRIELVATTPEDRVDQIFAPWDHPDGPGAAVAVARHGRVLHQNGYGSAQLEYGVPIEPATIFHVASVSKQFTAFSIAVLADRGRLSLDDDIRTHLPELPDFGHTITIRHLLHHTSGLRDQWNLLALAGWRLDDVITRDQIMRLITRQRELNFEPGAEYLYCNTGYTLLAEIVARVTGQSFPQWARENLFEPLGMTRTHFHDDHQEIVPDRAYSYANDAGGGYRKAVLSYANAGATSLFTTVGDLTRWMENLDSGRVGGPRVLEVMHARGVLNDGDTIGYALGLAHDSFRGLASVGHGGADAGFRSYAIRFPEEGLSIAVLSNVASFNPGRTAHEVAAAYLQDVLEPEPEEREAAEAGEGEPEGVVVDPEILDEYAGDYRVSGAVVKVSVEDGQLLAATPDETLRLEARSETEFHHADADATLTFGRDPDGGVSHFTLRMQGQELRAERLPPFQADRVDLSEYVGTYDSPELATTYELTVEDTVLVARHIRHDPITLTPTAADLFRGSTWFFGEVRFERNDAGITGMRVSSGRVRNILFVKRGDGPVSR